MCSDRLILVLQKRRVMLQFEEKKDLKTSAPFRLGRALPSTSLVLRKEATVHLKINTNRLFQGLHCITYCNGGGLDQMRFYLGSTREAAKDCWPTTIIQLTQPLTRRFFARLDSTTL